MRADPRAIEELGNCDSEDDDDNNWMPAPSDADPGTIKYTCQLSRLRRESHACGLKTSISRRLTPAGQFLTSD